MMIKPSINELDKVVGNRYSLVCAVAKRAREITADAFEKKTRFFILRFSLTFAESDLGRP